MGYFEGILILFVLAMLNFTSGMMNLKKFIAQCPRITDLSQLSLFKDMVRRQMYQALLQLVLLLGMTVVSVIGILRGRLSFVQFVMVLVLDGVVFYAGKQGKELEHRVQHMTVDDAEIKVQYREIVRVWNEKPFPDF